MTHEIDTGAIGKQVAKQTFEQRGEPGEALSYHGNGKLDSQEHAKVTPGKLPLLDGANDLVHDELANPKHRNRDAGPYHPEQQDADDIFGLGAPDQLEQRSEMTDRAESLSPTRRRRIRLSAAEVRAYNRMGERQ